jgi:hypothetical protein
MTVSAIETLDMAGFTYSLQQSRMTISGINLVETHSDIVGFTYILQ